MASSATNFGDRLTWIRVNLFREESERAFAKEIGLVTPTQIGGWRKKDPKTGEYRSPRLDIVVSIWDTIARKQPRNVNLLWLVTGRGDPLPVEAPASLRQALREGAYSASVEAAAIAFFEHTNASFDVTTWSLLLDKWAAVEAEGIRLAGGSPRGEEGGNQYTSMFDVAMPSPRTTTRAKKLGRPRKR